MWVGFGGLCMADTPPKTEQRDHSSHFSVLPCLLLCSRAVLDQPLQYYSPGSLEREIHGSHSPLPALLFIKRRNETIRNKTAKAREARVCV